MLAGDLRHTTPDGKKIDVYEDKAGILGVWLGTLNPGESIFILEPDSTYQLSTYWIKVLSRFGICYIRKFQVYPQ